MSLGLYKLNSIVTGDCANCLREIPDESITAVFCDPPYGLAFMGKGWDSFKDNAEYQAWVTTWAAELLRACKPGAVGLFFGGTRTFHRLACGLEDAGWELYDTLMWMYGSGFPKSMSISKAIDKAAGAEREVVGVNPNYCENRVDSIGTATGIYGGAGPDKGKHITAPATDLAQTWDGYGTALKPSYEPVLLCRKPRGKTYAKCAVEGGAGALNIDECRVGYQSDLDKASATPQGQCTSKEISAIGAEPDAGRDLERVAFNRPQQKGRWPANLILDEGAAAMLDEMSGDCSSARANGNPNNPVHQQLPDQLMSWGGVRETHDYRDRGGASRFFYTAKASRREREAGLENLPVVGRKNPMRSANGTGEKNFEGGFQDDKKARNPHPTVKPIALTEYLARLIRPPEEYLDDAVILIPFAGVGSEIIGAIKAGWRNWLGIEISEEYAEIANARIAYWQAQPPRLGLPSYRPTGFTGYQVAFAISQTQATPG